MANGWKEKYPVQQHEEIGSFLAANPGDEARIGTALDLAPWEGNSTGDTSTIPGEIPSALPDTEYGLAFRPVDLDPAYHGYTDQEYFQKVDPSYPAWPTEGFEDFQVADRTPGILGALTEQGYTTGLDPADTAMAGMPDYNIYAPDSPETPLAYALRAYGTPPPPPPAPDDEDLEVGEVRQPEAGKFPLFDPVGAIDPETGNIQEPVQTLDYPYTPPQMQTIGTTNWGDDPISQVINAGLRRMGEEGGIVPTDLAFQTEDALSQIMGAGGGGGAAPTPLGWDVQNEIQDLISNYGVVPRDRQREGMEFEQMRSPIDAMRRAQLAQGQAAMASRNILGQGPEVAFMEGLEERLAPQYAAAGQQLALAEMDRADQRYQQALTAGMNVGEAQAQRREGRLSGALQLATGMSNQQAQNMLQTAATWTDRQQMLTETALGALDRDILWSKFLAEYGLEREKFIEMVQSGRLKDLLPLITTYLDQVRTAAGGTVPYDVFD
tara:strand:+ start:749 stop:2230 length:1482 start_codon:yes stop_codon:yes gene_type:complete